MVSEAVDGILIGGLMVPLGLIQAISVYTLPLDMHCGLAAIKLRLLRALRGLGVCLHVIRDAWLIYPPNGQWPGTITAIRIRSCRSGGASTRSRRRWSGQSRSIRGAAHEIRRSKP